MDMYETLDKFEELILKELDKIIKKGDLTPTELSNGKEAICALKEIHEIYNSDKEDMGEEYSERGYYISPTSYRDEGTSMSNARGRRSSNRASSYNRGYSRHSMKDRMVAKLERMMDEAESDYERQEIREEIEHLRNS